MISRSGLLHSGYITWIFNKASQKLPDFEVTYIADSDIIGEEQDVLGLPNGASVIFANKDVGFERTASQEEMMVGCSPELCVVMLLVPTLKGDEVLTVQGAQATISMAGYGRSTRLFNP